MGGFEGNGDSIQQQRRSRRAGDPVPELDPLDERDQPGPLQCVGQTEENLRM
jgi:hypothetical protein